MSSNNSVKAPNGINHLALSTADMKGVLTYFNEVLGMPLVALYWMHGADNAFHGFMQLNETSLLAFVYIPGNPTNIELGLTHPGTGAGCSAGGTMQHVAFNVDTHDDLLALRDRIRAHNVHCMGPIEHGFCTSIYFAGPEGMTLEVTALTGEDIRQWIDPEVVELVGLSPEELEKLKNPTPFQQPADPVPQPPLESASAYQLAYPEADYEMIVSLPDEVITESTSDVLPPGTQ